MNAQCRQEQPAFQRNALAPGILAAIALIISPLFVDGMAATIIQYAVAILALIVAWFALQARQWAVAGLVGALVFLTAGALIKNERVIP